MNNSKPTRWINEQNASKIIRLPNANASDPYAGIPYAEDAERAVIGAVLIDSNAFINVATFLSAEDFFLIRHTYIWRAMELLEAEKSLIDYITVCEKLREVGHLDDIGGQAYLLYLLNSTPNSVYAEIYGQMVKRTALRRRLLTVADEIKSLALDEQLSLEDVVDQVNARVYSVTDQGIKDGESHIKNVVTEYFDRLEGMIQNGKPLGLPTGLVELDAIIRGLHRGEMTVIAGMPGMGKTSLALTIAMNAAKLGARIAVFSIEMERQEIVQRLVSMETGIPTDRLKTGIVNAATEWPRVIAAMSNLSKLPINILDRIPDLTPLQFKRKLRRLMVEYGVDLAVIDGLWLMEADADCKDKERKDRVKHIARRMADTAKEFRVPILLVHQFNRDSSKRNNKRPNLQDLSESQGVEQNAPVVLALYREGYFEHDYTDQQTEIIVIKNRDGQQGTAFVDYQKSNSRYINRGTHGTV